MKVLICGDRNWTDKSFIKATIEELNPSSIVTGGARGADSLAEEVANELEVPVLVFQADWVKYGRAAGPIRNKRMLSEKPDLILAFHDDLSKSKGTKDMIRQAVRAGIKTKVLSHTPLR